MIGTRGMPTSYGGVERAVEELSVRLAERGYEVTVYCRRPYCTSRQSTYRGVELRYLPVINTKHLEAVSHSILATADAMVRGFDVIHFHATGPALCSPVARASGAHIVATVQGLDFQRRKWGKVATGVLWVGAWCTAHVPHRTIVVSEELVRHYRAAYGREALYIPNGVERAPADTATMSQSIGGVPYVLFLGRLVPEKRVHDLILAFRNVRGDARLVVAGPSSHTDEYVRWLHELADDDRRIELVGAVFGDEKARLLAGAYAFCQPSELEGLPISLLEALSYGVYPIVSDLPVHLEIVRDADGNPLGEQYPVGNVDALSAALERALASPECVAAEKLRGTRIVEDRYSWEAIAERVGQVYEDLLRHGRADVEVRQS